MSPTRTLRGIFTLRRSEILWFYQEGASQIFPDAWEHFVAPIPPGERHDMVAAYHRRLTGEDEDTQLACARAWSQWEGATLSLLPDERRVAEFGADRFALAFARAIGEYGSVIFISGNIPLRTEITPLVIVKFLENYQYPQATAVAAVMLTASFALLFVINLLQRWTEKNS